MEDSQRTDSYHTAVDTEQVNNNAMAYTSQTSAVDQQSVSTQQPTLQHTPGITSTSRGSNDYCGDSNSYFLFFLIFSRLYNILLAVVVASMVFSHDAHTSSTKRTYS
eukprot:m.1129260 g.1129260  ORF g.1129260 m.1129260 type:complete len:107 (+) comp24416_c0_seq6:504-824(+)